MNIKERGLIVKFLTHEEIETSERKKKMDIVRSRRGREREISPDRAKVCMQVQHRVQPIKKVQVVYYLSRNGQLEHPHYMEVTYFANQHLRLRDVLDRLTVLRGQGMPSLYAWSCKRSYKNGYVWNDLAENDIIYPSDGAEYVLKGSELVEGCTERIQQLHVSNNNRQQLIQEPNLHAKRKQQQQQHQQQQQNKSKYHEYQDYEEEDQEEQEQEQESQEEFEDEEKTSYTSSTTPHSRCSRGVSTDEMEEQPQKNPRTESTHHDSPPPPTSLILSEKPRKTATNVNNTSKRFEDGDPVASALAPGRNSVLLQLISCGNLTMPKTKNNDYPCNLKQNNAVKRSDSNLHKGVLYKTAVKVAEEDMINYMSENPRFGNLQSEEKEYFSGSIVESISESRAVDEPGLKRSNSYNEERSIKAALEEAVKEDMKKDKAVRGKCIPLKKSSTSTKQAKK